MNTLTLAPLESLPQVTPPTPYEGYKMMVEDYRKSVSGEVKPGSGGEHSPDELSELRRSLTHFAIQNGFGIERPSLDTGEEVDTLLSDLKKDEVLSELASQYESSATRPVIISPEAIKNPQIIKLPQVTANEFGRRVLERVGFVLERSAGSHRIYKLQKPEGGSISVTLPFRSNGEPVPPGTLRSIIKQTGLTTEQVLAMLR